LVFPTTALGFEGADKTIDAKIFGYQGRKSHKGSSPHAQPPRVWWKKCGTRNDSSAGSRPDRQARGGYHYDTKDTKQEMNEAWQAFQQFCAALWSRFSLDWLPVIEADLIQFWQWLFANPLFTLGISTVLLVWACLVIRKSMYDGWTFVRCLSILFLFVCGSAAILIVLHVV
jgi:hypothetical protein